MAYALSTTSYDGCVAASGLAGGPGLSTTVMPFILRGLTLAGIESVSNPSNKRRCVRDRMASNLRPAQIDHAHDTVVGLDGVMGAIDTILAGGMVGPTLVQPWCCASCLAQFAASGGAGVGRRLSHHPTRPDRHGPVG